MKAVYLARNIRILRRLSKECVYTGMFEEKLLLNEFQFN